MSAIADVGCCPAKSYYCQTNGISSCVNGSANALYYCAGVGAIPRYIVECGACVVVNGGDDMCSSSCCHANGYYCGNDLIGGCRGTSGFLYYCPAANGTIQQNVSCAYGCQTNAAGIDDKCATSPLSSSFGPSPATTTLSPSATTAPSPTVIGPAAIAGIVVGAAAAVLVVAVAAVMWRFWRHPREGDDDRTEEIQMTHDGEGTLAGTGPLFRGTKNAANFEPRTAADDHGGGVETAADDYGGNGRLHSNPHAVDD